MDQPREKVGFTGSICPVGCGVLHFVDGLLVDGGPPPAHPGPWEPLAEPAEEPRPVPDDA